MTNVRDAVDLSKLKGPTLVVDNKGFVKKLYSSNFRLRKKLTVHTNPNWRSPDQRAADVFVKYLEGRFHEEMSRHFGASEADINVTKMPDEKIVKLAVKGLRERGFNATVVELKGRGFTRITMSRRKR